MTVQEISRSDIACDGVGGGARADLAQSSFFIQRGGGWSLLLHALPRM